MADKYDPMSDYNYDDLEPQDSDPVSVITDSSTPVTLSDRIMNNSMLFSVIAAIIIYVLFILVKSLFSGSVEEEIQEVFDLPPVEMPVVKQQVEAKPVLPKPVEPVQVVKQPTVDSELINSIQANIASIAKQKKDTENVIGKISASISNVNNQLQQVANKVSELSADITELKTKVYMIENPPVKADAKPLELFYLRAAVWGRAFLVNSKSPNITVTVKVNDVLDDYGSVTGIYPSEGIVTTSSGRNIQFSPDET
ncbi:MAG: hypothetical protein CMF46_04995 [Legionellales bacterium]|nr:hypothetical protein [Legionellales bacterium]|tara:strand:- start:70 stop:831 length:762 start_codon:yes stop_codon:yes gene_type:complete